jgi:hypothetical protein
LTARAAFSPFRGVPVSIGRGSLGGALPALLFGI